MKMNIPNAITVSRILFAILIVFSTPFSSSFYTFYLLGGLTDMIDGMVARKLNQQSLSGARLDAMADFVFVIAVFVKILPYIDMPRWAWIWIIAITLIKIVNWGLSILKFHKIVSEHTVMNKLTGLILFLLPFCIDRSTGAIPVIAVFASCSVATFAALQERFR